MNNKKPIIYQLLPRLFANYTENCIPNGTIEQNGAGKMNGITSKILRGIKELGVTHVWYTGVIEHSNKTDYSKYGIRPDNPHVVKGNAGSPYAIKDYYDIDPDIAEDVPSRMEEFDALVTRTHDTGMGVIIDFVPNHVSRQYFSDAAPEGTIQLGEGDDKTKFFDPNNNFYYIPHQLFAPHIDLGEGPDAYVEFPAKASGNDCFNPFPSQFDWYETVKLNYGVDYGNHTQHFQPIPKTWFQMLDILRFWAKKGVDGFRCDMVHMVPIEFWQWAIPNVKERYPHIIFIAEIYDVSLYRDFINLGGFDYLYDKVNLYDTLRAVQCSSVSAAQITRCWQTVEGIGSHMLNFLENHDEQRFASVEYAGDASKVLPSLVVSSMISSGPFMVYSGQELGEKAEDAEGFSGKDGRTTIFDYWSVSTLRRWFNNGKADGGQLSAVEKDHRGVYAHLLGLLNSEKALSEGEFFDLMYVNFNNPRFNPHRHYAFMRRSGDDVILIAVNFSDQPSQLAINIPGLALGMYGVKEGVKKGKELISGREDDLTVSRDEPFTTHIAPWGAVAWKFSASRNRRKNICRSKE